MRRAVVGSGAASAVIRSAPTSAVRLDSSARRGLFAGAARLTVSPSAVAPSAAASAGAASAVVPSAVIPTIAVPADAAGAGGVASAVVPPAAASPVNLAAADSEAARLGVEIGRGTGDGAAHGAGRAFALLTGERLAGATARAAPSAAPAAKPAVAPRAVTANAFLPPAAVPAAGESGFQPPLPPLPPAGGQPLPPDPAKQAKRMMLGTAVMKGGMESVTLGVPLLALTAFGGATMVAALVVAYGLAQAAAAGLAGTLAERFTARKVLAGSVLAQAGLVAAIVALGTAGALTAATLLPLYLLVGGAVGVAETTRHAIPALILGQDGAALSRYNARLHIYYQVAGVSGALAAGFLIATAGPIISLVLQPPLYAAAAWFFWRVRHAKPGDDGPLAFTRPSAAKVLMSHIRDYIADARAGARLVLGDRRLKWIAVAAVLPQIAHRVFEGLLIPVFAKGVLGRPEASAWLLTASNAGELVGAAVLLRLASHVKGPSRWVALAAAGLTLIGTLALTKSLALLLPLVLVSSLTWSAGDISLRSEVQRRVEAKDQPRALSFLFAAYVLGSAAASFALGAFLDWMGVAVALAWVAGAMVLLAAGVWHASRKL